MNANRDEVSKIVGIVLVALGKVAQTTRTPADDLMVGILKSNQAKLVDAVLRVLETEGPATEASVVAALRGVGIKTT